MTTTPANIAPLTWSKYMNLQSMEDNHLLNAMMKMDKLARDLWKQDGMHKDSNVIVDSDTPEYVKRQTWRNYLPNEYWLLEAEAKKRGLI